MISKDVPGKFGKDTESPSHACNQIISCFSMLPWIMGVRGEALGSHHDRRREEPESHDYVGRSRWHDHPLTLLLDAEVPAALGKANTIHCVVLHQLPTWSEIMAAPD